MDFRKDAKLDPTQVEDRSGMGGMRGGRGMALGGGAGAIGLIVVLLVTLLGGEGIDLSALQSLDGVAAGGQQQGEVHDECRSGEDAESSNTCRLIGTVNSIQAYWGDSVQGYRAGDHDLLLGLDGHRLRLRHGGRRALPTARRTGRCTSTSGSSRSCRLGSARRADRSRRRTCSRTSTGTTCRTSSAPSTRWPAIGRPAERGGPVGAPGGLLRRRLGVERRRQGGSWSPSRTSRSRRRWTRPPPSATTASSARSRDR